MKITLEEVRRVASLAHLELEEEDQERLRDDLEQILAYVEKLNELDTSGVPPAIGTTSTGTGLREDRAGGSLPPDEALANAPESGKGHFKVPRVLPG